MKAVDWKQLERAARQAARGAYAPYSHYRVGAALLGRDGRMFTGINIENGSYGLTVCAERVALWRAVAEGVRAFAALALAAGSETVGTPCGACLQVLSEFCDPSLPIRCVALKARPPRPPREMTLGTALPFAFRLTSGSQPIRQGE